VIGFSSSWCISLSVVGEILTESRVDNMSIMMVQ